MTLDELFPPEWRAVMGWMFLGWCIPLLFIVGVKLFREWEWRLIVRAGERDRARARAACLSGVEVLPAVDVTDPAVGGQIRSLGVPCRRCGAANVLAELDDGTYELCCPFWRPGREPADSL